MKLKEQLERKIKAEGKSVKTFETYWHYCEDKPSKPTKTFCDNYFSKFFKHCASTESEPSVERQALIIYGSVYREDRGIVRCCKEGDGIEFLDLNWIFDDSKLLSYRFDLEGGSL